jgi:hypothetical protein
MPTRRRSRPGPVRGTAVTPWGAPRRTWHRPWLRRSRGPAPPRRPWRPARRRRGDRGWRRCGAAPCVRSPRRPAAGVGWVPGPGRDAVPGGACLLDRGRVGAPGEFGRWAGERLGVRRVHRDDPGHDERAGADQRRPPHEVAPAGGAPRVGSAQVVGGLAIRHLLERLRRGSGAVRLEIASSDLSVTCGGRRRRHDTRRPLPAR